MAGQVSSEPPYSYQDNNSAPAVPDNSINVSETRRMRNRLAARRSRQRKLDQLMTIVKQRDDHQAKCRQLRDLLRQVYSLAHTLADATICLHEVVTEHQLALQVESKAMALQASNLRPRAAAHIAVAAASCAHGLLRSGSPTEQVAFWLNLLASVDRAIAGSDDQVSTTATGDNGTAMVSGNPTVNQSHPMNQPSVANVSQADCLSPSSNKQQRQQQQQQTLATDQQSCDPTKFETSQSPAASKQKRSLAGARQTHVLMPAESASAGAIGLQQGGESQPTLAQVGAAGSGETPAKPGILGQGAQQIEDAVMRVVDGTNVRRSDVVGALASELPGLRMQQPAQLVQAMPVGGGPAVQLPPGHVIHVVGGLQPSHTTGRVPHAQHLYIPAHLPGNPTAATYHIAATTPQPEGVTASHNLFSRQSTIPSSSFQHSTQTVPGEVQMVGAAVHSPQNSVLQLVPADGSSQQVPQSVVGQVQQVVQHVAVGGSLIQALQHLPRSGTGQVQHVVQQIHVGGTQAPHFQRHAQAHMAPYITTHPSPQAAYCIPNQDASQPSAQSRDEQHSAQYLQLYGSLGPALKQNDVQLISAQAGVAAQGGGVAQAPNQLPHSDTTPFRLLASASGNSSSLAAGRMECPN